MPWNATEDEAEALQVIREEIPDEMRDALETWLFRELAGSYGSTEDSKVHLLQSALRVNLQIRDRYPDTWDLIRALKAKGGDDLLLGAVDLQLSMYPVQEFGIPNEVLALSTHLDLCRAAIRTEERDGVYRLARRLPDGVEQLGESAVLAAGNQSGTHLARAWEAATSIEPDPEKAFSEGIKAVELAANAVVTPRAKKVRLSMIVQALKDKQDWRLVLDQREDGVPDHRATLIGMLETLVFAQSGRHGGAGNTAEQARAHVMLASLLVGWFASGAVLMKEPTR